MKNTTRTALRTLLAQRSLIVGPITLSNGSESDHYFDCKKVMLSSDGAALVGESVFDVIREQVPKWPDAIGGLTHGADPIISAVMMVAHERGLRLDGFYVRKEPKNHGTRNLIENAPQPGASVIIVDDVVTAGGSVMRAVQEAQRAGCNVIAVITLIDRLEGGGDKIKANVERYIPLYTLDDFRSDIERQLCQQDTSKSELLSTGVSR
jgi:orotate phosphoribosyltransferase